MEKFIYFTSRDTFFRIELSQIAYFEADGNYTKLYLTNQRALRFSFNLGAMKEHLKKSLQTDASKFVRVGKSLIINLGLLIHINFNKQTFQLYEGTHNSLFELSASKEALKSLKEVYIKL